MKQLKKVGALMLAFSMVIGIAACGGETDPKDTPKANQEPQIIANNDKEEGPEIVSNNDAQADPYEIIKGKDGKPMNLGGMEIFISDWFYSEQEPTNAYQEEQKAWRDWIQETYNFKITGRADTTWGNCSDDYVKYVEGGGSDENIIFTIHPLVATAAKAMGQGLMYDLASIDWLNFDDEKWDRDVMEFSTRGEKIYAMRAEASEPRNGIYFNYRILEEANINPEDLYKWQAEGTWTWDKFEEICEKVQKDTDNDGVIDQYAMCNFASYFYPSAVWSNKGAYIGLDENGQLYSRLESKETMDALKWADDMMKKYNKPNTEDGAWNYFISEFQNGKVCFMDHQTYLAGQDLKTCVDKFGFVCFPKPEGVDGYYAWTENNMMVIPATYSAEKAEKIAFAYNLWTAPVPGYEGYPAWKFSYYNNFKDSPKAVDETLPRLVDPQFTAPRMDYSVAELCGDTGLHGELLNWKFGKDQTIAEIMDEIRGTVQGYLDKANGK